MALYRIERHCEHMTQQEVSEAAFRSTACLRGFPELHWIRSFYDPEKRVSHCYYETQAPEKITEHATASGIPCDVITEVLEYTPAMWEGREPMVLKF